MTGPVHLHARTGTGPGCLTVCGVPCGSRESTAYRDLDPERVTCPDCKGGRSTDPLPTTERITP